MAQDLAALQSDVASFAAQLGLASGSSDGFNDSDFRKKGPVKPKVSPGESRKNAPGLGNAGFKSKNENRAGVVDRGKHSGKKANHGNDARNNRSSGPKKTDQGLNFSNRGGNSAFSGEDAHGTKKRLDIPPGKENKFAKQVSHSLGARWTGEKWHEAAEDVSSNLTFIETEQPATEEIRLKKREEGEFMLKRIAFEFEQSRRSDSGMKWINSARRSGTSADKVAALTVLIQENPLANLHTLDVLVGTVTSKGGKRHALGSIDVLKELFVTGLLPDRKLKPFSSRPIERLPDTKDGATLLLFWFWEDCLKQRYKQFVDGLVEGTMDVLTHLKLKSLKTLYELLNSRPELERQLLLAIVNKLGDPERKAASNAGHSLSCVLNEHPNMKKVVIQEVEQFVFRPNVGLRAIYYASIFLNQLVMSSKGEGPSIAKQLIDIYFGLFKVVTSKTEAKIENVPEKKHRKKETEAVKDEAKSETVEIDSRILRALLTGVNRAFPFVGADDADALVQEHTPSLFRLVHSPNLNVGIQALMLLHQLLAKHQAVSDRFHRALYAVLLSPALTKSTKMEMFLSLTFNVLKNDIKLSRIAAFVKRLLQVAVHQPPNFGCACLNLISEVLKAKPLLWGYILEPANQDDDDEHFKDVELPEDRRDEPKTETQASPEKDTEMAPADDSDTEISLADGIGDDLGDDDSDDLVEDDSDDEETEKKTVKASKKTDSGKEVGQRSRTRTPQAKQAKPAVQGSVNVYNSQHRDPLYCNADKCCWWELTLLATHNHPSVSTMARTILCNAHVVYFGNPLHDLGLAAFLDRFAERKQRPLQRESKDVRPKAAISKPELVGLPEDEVAPEEMIFHRFYAAKAASGAKPKKQKKRKDAEGDELLGGSDEDESDEDVGRGAAEDDDDEIEPMVEASDEEDDDIEAMVEASDDEGDSEGEGFEDESDEDDEAGVASPDENDSFAGSDDSEDEEIDKLLDKEMAMELSRDGDESDEASDEDEDEDEDDGGFEMAEKSREKSETKAPKDKTKKKRKASKRDVVDEEFQPPRQKRKKTLTPFASAEKYSHLIK